MTKGGGAGPFYSIHSMIYTVCVYVHYNQDYLKRNNNTLSVTSLQIENWQIYLAKTSDHTGLNGEQNPDLLKVSFGSDSSEKPFLANWRTSW